MPQAREGGRAGGWPRRLPGPRRPLEAHLHPWFTGFTPLAGPLRGQSRCTCRTASSLAQCASSFPLPSRLLQTDRVQPEDVELENEPWYQFFSELEFGRPVSEAGLFAGEPRGAWTTGCPTPQASFRGQALSVRSGAQPGPARPAGTAGPSGSSARTRATVTRQAHGVSQQILAAERRGPSAGGQWRVHSSPGFAYSPLGSRALRRARWLGANNISITVSPSTWRGWACRHFPREPPQGPSKEKKPEARGVP